MFDNVHDEETLQPLTLASKKSGVPYFSSGYLS